MGIYDNVVFETTPDSLATLPFDVTTERGEYRLWQTKDLNPSMDCYLLREANGSLVLYRRHPPIVKWTDTNEGLMGDRDEDVIDDADHWRQVRFTGDMRVTTLIGKLPVDLLITLQNGVVSNMTVQQPPVFEQLGEHETILLTTGHWVEDQNCVWNDNEPSGNAAIRFINPDNPREQILLSLQNIDAFRDALIQFDPTTADRSDELSPSGRVTYSTTRQQHTCVVCGESIDGGTGFIRLYHDPLEPREILVGMHTDCRGDAAAVLNQTWKEYGDELLADSL